MTISTETFIAVNAGASANDGTGDSLRAAFVKLNQNFSNISDVGFDAGNINVTGTIAVSDNIEVVGNVNATHFVGDGQYLSNVVGSYGNASVSTFLPTYSGNIGSLAIVGNVFLSNAYIPTANTSSGFPGQFSFDGNYVYICVATDTWKRANLAAW